MVDYNQRERYQCDLSPIYLGGDLVDDFAAELGDSRIVIYVQLDAYDAIVDPSLKQTIPGYFSVPFTFMHDKGNAAMGVEPTIIVWSCVGEPIGRIYPHRSDNLIYPQAKTVNESEYVIHYMQRYLLPNRMREYILGIQSHTK